MLSLKYSSLPFSWSELIQMYSRCFTIKSNGLVAMILQKKKKKKKKKKKVFLHGNYSKVM